MKVKSAIISFKIYLYITENSIDLGCIEKNADYWYNDVRVNGKMNLVLPDFSSCKAYCHSYGTQYFAWRGDAGGHCWCKTKLDPVHKRNTKGSIVGATSCNAG